MSPTESFDELEQRIAGLVENALNEIREEFIERLQGVQERLQGTVTSEIATAQEEAASEATAAAEVEEAKAAILAEAEEDKAAAIAAALEARESDFAQALESRESEQAEALEAKDAAIAAAEEAREAAIAEAQEAWEARDAAVAEAESARESALDDAAATTQETLSTALAEAMQGLRASVARINRAQSQAEVLEALLGESAAFASRSLLFLTREDGLQGWGSQGLETSEGHLQEVHMEYAESAALSELSTGRGTIQLSGEDCGALCNIIDGSQPREGALIPLVLRDRLAAALYTDRLEADSPFHPVALQILTYVAAQALETLPLRERSSTPTLRLATEAPADEPGVELWQFQAPAELAEESVAEVLEEPVPVPAKPQEIEAEEAMAEPGVPVVEEVEPEPPAEAWEQPAETPEPVAEAWKELAETPEPVAEAWEEPAETPEPVAEAWKEPAETPEPVAEAWEEPAEAPEPVAEAWEEPAEVSRPAPADLLAAEDSGFAMEEAAVVEEVEPEPAVEEEAVEVVAEEIEPEAVVEEVEPVAETAPESPAEVRPPTEIPPPAPAPAAGAEVAPPVDVDGPGWAFTTRRFSGDTGEDATHEEARRLARLLVTEIKLYNEEQVEEGRRGRNIYRALKDDIDRSRQIYEERIDEAVRADTDYFRDELVKILAAGDSEALGL